MHCTLKEVTANPPAHAGVELGPSLADHLPRSRGLDYRPLISAKPLIDLIDRSLRGFG